MSRKREAYGAAQATWDFVLWCTAAGSLIVLSSLLPVAHWFNHKIDPPIGFWDRSDGWAATMSLIVAGAVDALSTRNRLGIWANYLIWFLFAAAIVTSGVYLFLVPMSTQDEQSKWLARLGAALFIIIACATVGHALFARLTAIEKNSSSKGQPQ